ncbi:hypothetical protein FHU36_007959 [Nonomuraea muscovyensis]|uniref:Novel STAND NTPase 1 domain-containing protein n=1 Tax=Nonomuraea muscovyensis TaxID=1124761 RepID=A0A7X0CC26_9ACTN|nr:hypothetical protein [Nonomuraea muscovyensis]MBB6351376.1 hypothetical protein [Nonomuraea muscovyensis]
MTDRLGGYWLGARLGGRAHEVYDEPGVRRVLTRLSPPLDAGDRAAVEAAGRVRSLRVAALTDSLLDGATPYVVGEYVEGLSVREAVARHGPFAGDDLYRLATATATALAAVHEAGTAHGRLTPDRVLLTAEGPRVVGLGVPPRDRTPADDVRDWGELMLRAAGDSAVPDRLCVERALSELVMAARGDDPAWRPDARRLLVSLLDAPSSQQGTLLPPEPVHDPPLGARAETVYLRLDRTEQDLAPEIFLRLVGLDAAGIEGRRAAARARLVSGRTPDQTAAVDRVLAAYEEEGLLTRAGPPDLDPHPHLPDRPQVTSHDGRGDGDGQGDGPVVVAYGALLRAWPRLREWVDAERAGLPVHEELAAAARRWEGDGWREADLFRGEALDRALDWAANGRRRLTLTSVERAFLDAGLTRTRRQGRRRRTAVTALLSAALVVTLLAVVAAVRRGGAAEERLETAMARVAASRADELRPGHPVAASRLALAAWLLSPVAEARGALARAAADPAVDVFADPYAGSGSVYALSLDGGRLAALGDGVVRVYDVRSRRQVARAAAPAQSVRAMAWSPDGRTLALVGVDRSYLWDTASDAEVGPPFGRGLGPPGQQAAWFSPGGRLLFAAARQSGERWGWDLRARRAAFAGEYAVVGPDDRVALVFAGRRSQLRRLDTGARVERAWLDRMPWEYTTFAPDGERVAIAEESGVQIYGLDGVPALPARLRPSPGVPRFSPDGRLLAATDSARVRLWRIADGTLLVDRPIPPAAADRPAQAAPTADGRWLRVLAGRGTVLTLDAAHAVDTTDPARVAASLCARHGGPSPAEWARHLPELPHREVCGG